MNQQQELEQINRRYPQRPGEININRQRALSEFSKKWHPNGMPDEPAIPSDGDRFVASDPNEIMLVPQGDDSNQLDALSVLGSLGMAAAATGDDEAYRQIMGQDNKEDFGDTVNITTAPMKQLGT
jgi:hypothetical protein